MRVYYWRRPVRENVAHLTDLGGQPRRKMCGGTLTVGATVDAPAGMPRRELMDKLGSQTGLCPACLEVEGRLV